MRVNCVRGIGEGEFPFNTPCLRGMETEFYRIILLNVLPLSLIHVNMGSRNSLTSLKLIGGSYPSVRYVLVKNPSAGINLIISRGPYFIITTIGRLRAFSIKSLLR